MGGLFGGGGYKAPTVEMKPESQAPKKQAEGAGAAAQAQRERARRNRGLTASIMTNRAGSGGLESNVSGNATLGG